MLKQYFDIIHNNMMGINNVQHYGIPRQAHYVIKTHDEIKKYIEQYPNTKLGKIASNIYEKVSKTTLKLYTKAERYNLRVDVPKSMRTEQPTFNGERIHIKLEEVL